MLDFYQQLAQALAQGPVVLATLANVKGSAPREVGAKMIVCPDGSIIGTIGGGAGEAKVISQALQILETGKKQFVEIDLSGARNRATQGVCGGTMQVWLERWMGADALILVNQILDLLKSRQLGALVTPFEPNKMPYLLQPFLEKRSECQHELVEPLLPPPTLLIIGAGHVAVPLAQIARIAGFEIAVFDDRSEFASKERFPIASFIFNQSLFSALDSLSQEALLYVALVTRGYQHDLEALRILLNRATKYIGMIGSKKRVQMVRQALEQEGYSSQTLNRIYAPIGLDIGALTPEEIAVSICAELIKVRRAPL